MQQLKQSRRYRHDSSSPLQVQVRRIRQRNGEREIIEVRRRAVNIKITLNEVLAYSAL